MGSSHRRWTMQSVRVGVAVCFLGLSAWAGSRQGQELGTDAFRRGDINGDLSWDISDPVYLLGNLMGGGPAPLCLDTADTNDDGALNIADVVQLLNYLFVASVPALPLPFPAA